MPQLIYRIVSHPKFEPLLSKEAHVFQGTVEDILFKYGPQNSNPLKGFVSKGVHYVYKFYLWTGFGWEHVSDPRPNAYEDTNVSQSKN